MGTPETVDELAVLANRCVEICAEHKAENVLLFDVRGTTILADFYLLCTATSQPHIRALTNHFHHDLLAAGVNVRVEGSPASCWVVIDCGAILVHIMDEERRAFYQLEELWGTDKVSSRSPTEA